MGPPSLDVRTMAPGSQRLILSQESNCKIWYLQSVRQFFHVVFLGTQKWYSSDFQILKTDFRITRDETQPQELFDFVKFAEIKQPGDYESAVTTIQVLVLGWFQ